MNGHEDPEIKMSFSDMLALRAKCEMKGIEEDGFFAVLGALFIFRYQPELVGSDLFPTEKADRYGRLLTELGEL